MSINQQIAAAGIVGCGGAGFPTHVKMAASPGWLILNGAECEPLLGADRYAMRHYAGRMVAALAAVADELGVSSCTIAIKRKYAAEKAALQAAIDELAAPITIHLMDSYYPAGDEVSMVYEVSGQCVPAGGIPLDVGCVVVNACTVLAIGDAMQGRPFTRKLLSVNGEVEQPLILNVPLGISLAECIDAAGGAKLTEYAVLLGGPMMGRMLTRAQAAAEVVHKTTSGINILPADHYLAHLDALPLTSMVKQAQAACIGCSRCTEMCPRNLLGHPLRPHQIMRRFAMSGDLAEVAASPIGQQAALCCECGICELIACPMDLKPRRINAAIKSILAQSGYRHPKGQGQEAVHPWREYRQIPSTRAAARSGVLPYEHAQLDTLLELDSSCVSLALKQSAGVPAQPVVAVGDEVREGQLIATCPDGKLGANLHASISGTVADIGHSITIRRGGNV